MSKRLKSPAANQGGRVHVDPGGGQSTQTSLVRFSFLHFRTECIANCTPEELDAFFRRLRLLSGITWQQITSSHRHGLGSEKIPRGQLLVPIDVPDDVEILAFRYHGADPMLGYREGDVLHVLWVSHNHDAYRG